MIKEEELFSLVDVLLSSDKIFGLMVLGSAGIGKTRTVMKYLDKKSMQYSIMRTYSSPLSLYAWLFYNRNEPLIVMDDVDGIWDNDHSAAILKSALWEDDQERIVEWHTTSKANKLPSSFVFKSKIIFICNKTRDNPHVDAVLSRVLHYKFTYTRDEMLKQMKEICKEKSSFNLTKKEKLEVVNMIEQNASIFDFRTMIQGFAVMEHSKTDPDFDWKATFMTILTGDANKELKFVYDLSKTTKPVEEQALEYINTFSKSRRTFFNLRKKLKDSGCL